jgi:hypothetical protein
MSEPDKELLRVSDILRWIPGTTRYQVEILVQTHALKPHPLPGMKQQRFHKEEVRRVFLNQPTT